MDIVLKSCKEVVSFAGKVLKNSKSQFDKCNSKNKLFKIKFFNCILHNAASVQTTYFEDYFCSILLICHREFSKSRPKEETALQNSKCPFPVLAFFLVFTLA